MIRLFLAGLALQVSCSQSILVPGYHVERPEPMATRQSEPVDQNNDTAGDPLSGQGAQADKVDEASKSSPDANTPTPAPVGTNATPVPATGSLTVSLNLIPPTPAGTYRNRGHVRSIWITDANDKYLKTIHAFAGVRSGNLRRWQSFTNNTADGTTGATQTTPAAGLPISATWDLKDKAGLGMMTGNYKLWLEFSEANTPALDQGKKSSDPLQAIDNVNGYEYLIVAFTLSPQGFTKTDSSNAVFKDLAVKQVP